MAVRLVAWIGLLVFGLSAARAQLMPPANYFEWSGLGGNGLWQTGQNWIGDAEPTLDADVLFANAPPDNNTGNPYQALIVVEASSATDVNALWFETGREYVIKAEALTLGSGLADNGHLITSLNNDPSRWQSEHTVSGRITLQLARSDWTAQIASYSAGALRIDGGLHLSRGNLKQTGGGAIHLSARLSNAGNPNGGNLTIATNAGHMILSGKNSTWTGRLTVNHGFLVATQDGALGSTTRAVDIAPTISGATLAFRPQLLAPGVDYTSAQPVNVTGRGYLRPWGAANPYDPHSPLNLRPVGAIYNDGGNNSFAGDITARDETWFGSRHGVLTLKGRLFGDPDNDEFLHFTKVGHGVIDLANSNPGWSEAQFDLNEGVLRVSDNRALSQQHSLILFKGGILELGSGNFSGTLGTTGTGRIGWDTGNHSGGFSAHGGNRSVTLNDNANLTWGVTSGFVGNGAALLLNSEYGTHQISLQNAINLGSQIREVRVARGATTGAHAQLAGRLSGTGGLLKTGLGTLLLSGTSNSYRGATRIREGTLGGKVPSQSRIDFDGGVLGIEANFSRSLGNASGRIRWLRERDGGFANYATGLASVTLNPGGPTPATVSFGQSNFVSHGSYLIFGAYDAVGTVDFKNRLGLRANAISMLRIISGTQNGAVADVLFSSKFYGPTGGNGQPNQEYNLLIEGDGRADINQAHTISDWEGRELQVRGAELRLNQAGTLQGIEGIALIDWGGTLTLDNQGTYQSLNTGGSSVADRIHDQVTIALNAGTFRLWGGVSNLTETAGPLLLLDGANSLQVRSPLPVGNTISLAATRLHLAQLQRTESEHPTINFEGLDLPGGRIGTRRFLTFATAPTLTGGILPYATVNKTDWARTQTTGGLNYVTAYTDYETGGENTWTTQGGVIKNASPNDNITLSQNRSINSLRLTSGRQVTLTNGSNAYTLNVNSGGLLATGTTGTRINGGTLRAGKEILPLYAHVYNTAAVGLDISSTIEATALVKTGSGLLRLSGGGSVGNVEGGSFTTRIHEGTLALGKTTHNYLGGTIIVGDRSGRDILRLDNAEQIANSATVILRGGHPDPARFLMAEGILQFNGSGGVGIRETIGNLTVEGRGVIDFQGGTGGEANFLIIEGTITIGEGSKLFIRNWYEYEDYLLIRRNGASSVDLSRIEFEGYGPAFFRDWNGEFFQITVAPEPTTTGAILGSVGLGLALWQRKRRLRHPRRP